MFPECSLNTTIIHLHLSSCVCCVAGDDLDNYGWLPTSCYHSGVFRTTAVTSAMVIEHSEHRRSGLWGQTGLKRVQSDGKLQQPTHGLPPLNTGSLATGVT